MAIDIHSYGTGHEPQVLLSFDPKTAFFLLPLDSPVARKEGPGMQLGRILSAQERCNSPRVCYVMNEAGRPLAKTFPRSARLLKRAEFDTVYRQGRRHFTPAMSMFYLDRRTGSALHSPRIGLTVGRALGGAVVRNRIKRRVRAMVREHLHLVGRAVDIVINPKRLILDIDAQRLSEEVRKAFLAIARQLESKPITPGGEAHAADAEKWRRPC